MAKSLENSSLKITEQGTDGLIISGYDTKVPETTAGIFAVGCEIQNIATGVNYRNGGTTASPSWQNTDEIATAEIADGAVTGVKLGAMTSAELATAVSNETGSGLLVFATSPNLTTPAIGAATGASLALTGAATSSGATSGVGYATGAGGAVTQATSKATAFTLSKVSGQITMAADALAAGTIVSSAWTNTAVAATDVIVLTHVSGGTVGSYTLNAQAGAGSATLNIRNNTAGSLSEALVIGFVVIKGVTA